MDAGRAAQGLGGRGRDRHPLQRALLRARPRRRRELEHRGLGQRDRPGLLVRGALEDQHRLHRHPAAALRLLPGAGRRARPLPGGAEEPAAGREGQRVALRRQFAGRLPDLAGEEGRGVGLPAAADAVPAEGLPGAVDGLQLPLQPVRRRRHRGRPGQVPGVGEAGQAGLPQRLRAGLQRQPRPALRRQPLRDLERRHLHAGRRGRRQGRVPPQGRAVRVLQGAERLARRAGPGRAGQAAHPGPGRVARLVHVREVITSRNPDRGYVIVP
ncbi:hypothetical protein SBRY_50835 [Actinacidiphila bryophytorum]|uniref:Uncharacterized protein n=1 Tax=Actinacidiphila bryophytorum TaxID=1436133 RepID=A0A9W4H5L6_9ACTN|nr:hypothetical protein SBRY_50835 [Actinacidiphila bryophytorum]